MEVVQEKSRAVSNKGPEVCLTCKGSERALATQKQNVVVDILKLCFTDRLSEFVCLFKVGFVFSKFHYPTNRIAAFSTFTVNNNIICRIKEALIFYHTFSTNCFTIEAIDSFI
jgi:hypothetical protein